MAQLKGLRQILQWSMEHANDLVNDPASSIDELNEVFAELFQLVTPNIVYVFDLLELIRSFHVHCQ
jgi:hypothetical protein